MIICNHNKHEAAFKYKIILPFDLSLILRNTSIRQNLEAKKSPSFQLGRLQGRLVVPRKQPVAGWRRPAGDYWYPYMISGNEGNCKSRNRISLAIRLESDVIYPSHMQPSRFFATGVLEYETKTIPPCTQREEFPARPQCL